MPNTAEQVTIDRIAKQILHETDTTRDFVREIRLGVIRRSLEELLTIVRAQESLKRSPSI